jgi:hypothetical protein
LTGGVRADVFFVQFDIAVGQLDLSGFNVTGKKRFCLPVEFFQIGQPLVAFLYPVVLLRFR